MSEEEDYIGFGKVTMSLEEFRTATKDLPDDTEIFMNVGDLQFAEVRLMAHLTKEPAGALPPVLDHPYALLLEMGQIWNTERDLDHRLDAALGT